MSNFPAENLLSDVIEYTNKSVFNVFGSTVHVKITLRPEGYRCGYLWLSGADHTMIYKLYKACDAEFYEGITYDRDGVFGFDCGHLCDKHDVKSLDFVKDVILTTLKAFMKAYKS